MVTVVTASDLVNVNQLNFIASQEDEAKVVIAARWWWWWETWQGWWRWCVCCRQVWCEELFSLSSNLLSNNLNRDHGLLKAWVLCCTSSASLTTALGDTTSGAAALYSELLGTSRHFAQLQRGICVGCHCWLSLLVAADAGNPTSRVSCKVPVIQRFVLTIVEVNKYLNRRITLSLMQVLLLFAHFIAGTCG